MTRDDFLNDEEVQLQKEYYFTPLVEVVSKQVRMLSELGPRASGDVICERRTSAQRLLSR